MFFQHVEKIKYEIFIYYKFDKPLKFFENNKIKNTVNTKYAVISLIYAQNLLIKKCN